MPPKRKAKSQNETENKIDTATKKRRKTVTKSHTKEVDYKQILLDTMRNEG